MKKLERADELRQQPISLAQTYFSIEDIYLAKEKVKVARRNKMRRNGLRQRLRNLPLLKSARRLTPKEQKRLALVRKAEQDVERTSSERGELARKLDGLKRTLTSQKSAVSALRTNRMRRCHAKTLMAFAQEVEKQVEEATTQDAIQAALGDTQGGAGICGSLRRTDR